MGLVMEGRFQISCAFLQIPTVYITVRHGAR